MMHDKMFFGKASFVSCLCAAAMIALIAPGTASSEKPVAPIVMRAETDYGKVLAGQPQTVLVLVEFEAPEKETDPQKRPQMNLSLVLDRSGSMDASGKMTYAKKAAKFLVGRLKPTDILSVVEYDDRITVLWPASPVERPDMIQRQIDGLRPRGTTNLTGGMMRGMDEVLRNASANRINRVLLLSDGLANRGITQPIEIAALVRKAREQGVSVSTMGLGLDYNEDLMTAIAENGAGNYYYIENPTQMTRIFEQEMGTLFATIGKEVCLAFAGEGAVEAIEVFGFQTKVDANRSDTPMTDFYSGEKRTLLLRLSVLAKKEGPLPLGTLTLSYLNNETKKTESLQAVLKVEADASQENVTASRNDRVVVEATLIEADTAHAKAVKAFQDGKRDEARRILETLKKDVDRVQSSTPDVKLVKKMEAIQMEESEMNQAATSMAARASYLKSSKERLYYAQKGKRGKCLLQEGDRGLEVERLQKKLRELTIYNGPVDGRFNPELTQAVMTFQRRQHLTVDGVVGPETLKALGLY